MRKNEIFLSPNHPSLLEEHSLQSTLFPPLIVSADRVLIDGYRRYRALQTPDVPAIQMEVTSLYDAAFQINRNTRVWDEIDIFFWTRWAESLGSRITHLPRKQFPDELKSAPPAVLTALVNRQILLGQAIRILQAPASTWPFFVEMLSSVIRLNVNETAQFMDITFDLANRQKSKNLNTVLEVEPLQQILNKPGMNARQKGEALLKGMRKLRYPLYQRKIEELSTAWRQLNLERLRVKKSLFLERGILELTITARSLNDLSEQVRELFESLQSSGWSRIWEGSTFFPENSKEGKDLDEA